VDVSRELRITATHEFRDGSLENIFMLNGKPMPDSPPVVVRQGQYVRLRLVNETDFSHPMHVHGHVFSVLSRNGRRITGSPVHLDSVMVGPRETWEVAFLADNPGLWMVHCHVLVHARFGLSTMLVYQGVSTPYRMGTRSGNLP